MTACRQSPGQVAKDFAAAAPKCSSSSWPVGSIVAAPGFRTVAHPKALEPLPSVVLFTFVPDEVPLTGPRQRMMTLKTRTAFNTDHIYAAIEATREGVGYAVLPYWAQDDLDSGRLIELCPQWHPPFLMLSVAYPPSRHRPVRISAFVDYLRTELPKAGAGIVATGPEHDAPASMQNAPDGI